jgi:hypothetical protein
MIKIDAKYCYLDDALGVPFNPEEYKAWEGTEGKVGDLVYQDPDKVSRKLYDDLKCLFNNIMDEMSPTLKLPLRFERYTKRLNLVDSYGRRYSSDFIGPSRAWAKYVLIEDHLIGEYLKKARTIGGHMIWPLNGTRRTINTSRGGGNSLYDRIDLTLAELRNYFVGEECWFSQGLRSVYEKEVEWFANFQDDSKDGLYAFIRFIRYWKLDPFVSGTDYQVISLANSDLKNNKIILVSKSETIFPGNDRKLYYRDIIKINESKDLQYARQLKDAYSKYIENNILAIEKRNELL